MPQKINLARLQIDTMKKRLEMYTIEFETHLKDRYIEVKDFEKIANKHVRVIILVEEHDCKQNKKQKSLAGALKKYANPTLIEKEKDIAWQQIAEEKSVIS